MKKSKYCSIIKIDDSYVLIYSALQDKFISYPISAFGDSNFIGETHKSSLLKQLQEIGAAVDDDLDEIAIAKQKMDQIDNDPSVFHLHINPTLNCNLRCWYCYENHMTQSKMGQDTQNSIVKLIINKLRDEKVKHFQLSFFGGEPMLCFENVALPLIEASANLTKKYNKSFAIHFTTNGTLINNDIIKCLNPYDVSFQITLDGYKDMHNQVRGVSGINSYDTIISNVRAIASKHKKLVLRINFTEKNIDSVPLIFKELSTWHSDILHNIHVDLQQVWQDINHKNEPVISDKIQTIMEYVSSIGMTVSSPWKATSICNSCYADKRNHLLVNYNGDIFFCTARDFNTENRKGYLNEDGIPVWENDSHVRHMSIKFTNPVCQECRIGALCGGGCRQKTAECIGKQGCPLGYDEDDIDDIILRRFERLVIIHHKKK